MEKTRRKYFIPRFKDAIFNFDEYRNFAEEKVFNSIKYFLKLIFIFSIIVAVAINIKVFDALGDITDNFNKQAPEFSFEDNKLVIQGENKSFITGYENIVGVIINSEISDIEEITEAGNYTNYIALLKDKVVIRGNSLNELVEGATTYEEISKNTDLSTVNKQTIENSVQNFSINFAFIFFIVYFIVSFIDIFIDVLLLFLLGYLISRILGMRIKNGQIFNICVYSITLPVVLLMLCTIVNTFTNFRIVYFDIAYRAISYIYLITALLIIKSDLIKQQMELTKIIKVQKQVQEELKEEKDKQGEKEEEQKKEPEEDNKETEDKNGKEPQGNQA